MTRTTRTAPMLESVVQYGDRCPFVSSHHNPGHAIRRNNDWYRWIETRVDERLIVAVAPQHDTRALSTLYELGRDPRRDRCLPCAANRDVPDAQRGQHRIVRRRHAGVVEGPDYAHGARVPGFRQSSCD